MLTQYWELIKDYMLQPHLLPFFLFFCKLLFQFSITSRSSSIRIICIYRIFFFFFFFFWGGGGDL